MLLERTTNQGDSKIHTNNCCLNKWMLNYALKLLIIGTYLKIALLSFPR